MASGEIQKTKAPDAAERADRVHKVFGWILLGMTEHQLSRQIAKQWPDQTSGPLIVAAMKQVMESGDADAGIVIGWAIEATRMIYQKAMAQQPAPDLELALKAVGQMARLAGK